MNYTLIFFLFASAVFILSTITICVAPIINGFLYISGNNNCQRYSDEYDYSKSLITDPTKQEKKELDDQKKLIGVCKRENAIYALEYSSLICDIVLGGICAILGLLHYLEIGKSIEKKTGLIGIVSGTIGFIITFIYIIFSGYIFTNDRYGHLLDKRIERLFPNKAYLKYNGLNYVPAYDSEKYEDNENIKYATYSELGQKQYNYDPDILKTYSEFDKCKENNYLNKGCNYVWNTTVSNKSIINKYIYDRWITTIIFGVFIFILNIGLALFGFFLFKELGETNSGSIPVPISSVNALENK